MHPYGQMRLPRSVIPPSIHLGFMSTHRSPLWSGLACMVGMVAPGALIALVGWALGYPIAVLVFPLCLSFAPAGFVIGVEYHRHVERQQARDERDAGPI